MSDAPGPAPERSAGGRPSVDPHAAPGQHAHPRSVRLPATVDAELAALSKAQDRPASAIVRDALTDYLRAYRDAPGTTGDPR